MFWLIRSSECVIDIIITANGNLTNLPANVVCSCCFFSLQSFFCLAHLCLPCHAYPKTQCKKCRCRPCERCRQRGLLQSRIHSSYELLPRVWRSLGFRERQQRKQSAVIAISSAMGRCPILLSTYAVCLTRLLLTTQMPRFWTLNTRPPPH